MVGTIAFLENRSPEGIVADIKRTERPPTSGDYQGTAPMVSELEQALQHTRRALLLYYDNAGATGAEPEANGLEATDHADQAKIQ